MEGLRVPPNPTNKRKIVSTPDNGLLYIAFACKSIAYVSAPLESNNDSNVKLITLQNE